MAAALSERRWRRARLRLPETGEEVEAPIYEASRSRLFKELLSSGCRLDCRYCPFSTHCRYRSRRVWTPEKLARAAKAAVDSGRASGVFLSSGIHRDNEAVSEMLVEAAERLRAMGYRGYLHLRLMPGTPRWLIRRALEAADRVGLNLEAPGEAFFQEIAPSKGSWRRDLLHRLAQAAGEARDPSRVSTQLMVGAAGESDRDHVRLVERLAGIGVGVVYYSPYIPVPGTPLAEKTPPAPAWRARQLTEASRLIIHYGYRAGDLEPLLDDNGNLQRLSKSLKEALAEAHPEWYPVDPETASKKELMRVPGIGPRTAQAIIEARRRGEKITPWLLARLMGPARLRRAARYLDLSTAGASGPTSGRRNGNTRGAAAAP